MFCSPAEGGQPLHSLSKASRRYQEPDLATQGAQGRAPVGDGCFGSWRQGQETEAMCRHIGTVPGKQSPAGEKTRKGPSREAILPSFQHPGLPWPHFAPRIGGGGARTGRRRLRGTSRWRGEKTRPPLTAPPPRRPPGGAPRRARQPPGQPRSLRRPPRRALRRSPPLLYGRCPWQGLCLLPAAQRRAAWGVGAAARR